MKNTPIDSKIELTGGGHLLRFSKLSLDIPAVGWSSTRLQPVKQAHEVPAPLIGVRLIGGVLCQCQPRRCTASHSKRYLHA